MSWAGRITLGLASLLAAFGAAKHDAQAEGLTVSEPSSSGTLSVASPEPSPPVEVSSTPSSSSTPLPVASEPAPSSAPQETTQQLQPAANPQPSAPSPETTQTPPSPAPAPAPAEVVQPAATPQTTAPAEVVQPATGGTAEQTPPSGSVPEAPPTATVTPPPSEQQQPATGIPVSSGPAQPASVEVSTSTTSSNVTVTTASPSPGQLQVSPPQSQATPLSGQELQGGAPQTPPSTQPSPAPSQLPAQPIQGSAPDLQGGGRASGPATQGGSTSASAELQHASSPEAVRSNGPIASPPQSPPTATTTPSSPPKTPKPHEAICVTVTYHELVGGGFEECGGPSPTMYLVLGVGEGGGVGVDRQPADDHPSITLHGEASISDGLASGGTSADLPFHGSPSVGASAGVLGYGPSATVTRSNGSFAAQLGIQGPLSKPEKNTRATGSSSKKGFDADGSVDLYVPIPWRYTPPIDTLPPPPGRSLFFGF